MCRRVPKARQAQHAQKPLRSLWARTAREDDFMPLAQIYSDNRMIVSAVCVCVCAGLCVHGVRVYVFVGMRGSG